MNLIKILKAITGFKVLLLLSLFFLLFQPKAYPQEDKAIYYKGIRHARRDEVNSAFMNFRRILNEFPESKYLEPVLFGLGEYHFSIGDYFNAEKYFDRFIKDYLESEARPFVLSYLINLANKKGEENLVEKFKKELVGLKQVSLLFSEFKELKYLSAFYKDYKAMYFIDKVEIYIDDELFEKITF